MSRIWLGGEEQWGNRKKCQEQRPGIGQAPGTYARHQESLRQWTWGAHLTRQIRLDLQVQLLISAQDVENYKVIKSELDRLRTMVEKSELWVDKKGSGKGEEVEAGAAKDKKEVSGAAGCWDPLPARAGSG